MFNILAKYAICEMLDAEDKSYRSKQRDASDNKTNVCEKRGLTKIDCNMLKQLDECIKDMGKIHDELDKIERDIKRLGSV